LPKIAKVLQYSEYDYLDAWFGLERLVTRGLVRSIGVSNFNNTQLQRVIDKARVKPVINQVGFLTYKL
jgi:diketogulonate reductase-like aldo/keto reductase